MSSCVAWVCDNWICNDGTMCVILTCVTIGAMTIPIMMVIPRLWGQCVAAAREAHRKVRVTVEYMVRLRLSHIPVDDVLPPAPQPQAIPIIPPHNLPCDDVQPIYLDKGGQDMQIPTPSVRVASSL